MLIDPRIRTIFDTLYTVLGVDIQYMRDKLLEQFDQELTRRTMGNVLAGFSDDQRRKYETFVNRSTALTPKEGAQFFEELCGRVYIEKVAQKEAKAFSEEYMQHILKGSTEEQKRSIQTLLQDFSKGYPQQ